MFGDGQLHHGQCARGYSAPRRRSTDMASHLVILGTQAIREQTGLSMKVCRAALEACDDDVERALTWIDENASERGAYVFNGTYPDFPIVHFFCTVNLFRV